MTILLGYLGIYLSIIFGSIFISSIFNKKIESCIWIDIIIKMILLYIFGLVGFLEIGSIVICVVSILLGIFSIIFYRKKINIKENVLTTGIIFFTFAYFAFMIFTFYKVTEIWDEYTYWSIASKKMFYSNNLVCDSLQIVYPPFPTLLQYYFNKIVGEYSQGRENFANIILCLALLMPLFEKIKSERKLPKICLSIIIICIPAIFDGILLYQSTYADAPLAFMIGALLYTTFNYKDGLFKYVTMFISLIGITLTKPSGFYISIILIGVIILYYFIYNLKKQKIDKENILKLIKNKKNILIILSLILIVLITYCSYYMYSKDFISQKNSMDRKIEELRSDEFLSYGKAISTIKTTMFGGTEETVDADTSNRTLFQDLMRYTTIRVPVRVSLMAFFLIYIATSVILYKKYIEANDKIKFKYFTIALVVGLITYILFIQFAYLVKFGTEEMLNHASLNRYINTYYIGMFVILLSSILNIIGKNEKNSNYKYILLTITIFIITPINFLVDATIGCGNYNNIYKGNLIEIQGEAEYIKETLNKEDRIYIVNQESNIAAKSFELKYFLVPDMDLIVTDKLSEDVEALFKDENMLDVWKNTLYNEYDYVYIYRTDVYFRNFARSVFNNKIMKDNTLYEIIKQEDGNIELKEIIRDNKGDNNEKN